MGAPVFPLGSPATTIVTLDREFADSALSPATPAIPIESPDRQFIGLFPPMADREEEDLQMAIRMSLQESLPEAKRSKPRETTPVEESPEQQSRRLQRELRAAAAEKRMRASESMCFSPPRPVPLIESKMVEAAVPGRTEEAGSSPMDVADRVSDAGEALSVEDTEKLFSMVFGSGVSKGILAQWSNQGIRFSPDPETCMGLVQHEGGPCGVLAAIQAFVLKNLIFFPDDLGRFEGSSSLPSLGVRKYRQRAYATNSFDSLTEDRRTRALVHSMVEILFKCGNTRRAVVATLGNFDHHSNEGSQKKEIIGKALEGLSVESASDLQKVLRVVTFTSQSAAFQWLVTELPVFESRMGAMLFLLSALLSRGLESIQADRDDPSLPLVTAPFGHASQEIVNLLLCGEAVPNVFDGRMDLGGGMSLKGIPASVEVGFLTLLEALNLCKVGQFLKCPKWPIWVIGSESHYTVLFALDCAVQEENKLEERESRIRRAFDAQDQSGGGGFITVEGLKQVLGETNINFPADKLDSLCSSEFIVWSEFWQALLELDRSSGGMKDSSGSSGKEFDIYHFNGIAKSVLNGSAGSESPVQRPRLCKLSVSVPPRWTQEEFLADVVPASSSSNSSWNQDGVVEVNRPVEPPQHAPLVDCIKTRWPRAVCRWVGDAPSIV